MYSKRHMRRLVAAEKKLILDIEEDDFESFPNPLSETEYVEINAGDEGNVLEENHGLELELRQWAVRHNVAGECFDDLLKILASQHLNVSKSAESIMKKQTAIIKSEDPGIEDQLKKISLETKKLESIVTAQAKTNIMLKELLKQREKVCTFPIMRMENLLEIEKKIRENKEEYIEILGPIVKHPLSKFLTNVVDIKVLLEFNYEGIKGKKAFRDFVYLNNVIFHCLSKEGYNRESYKKDVQMAFRRIKNRYFKDKCIKKQKESKKN